MQPLKILFWLNKLLNDWGHYIYAVAMLPCCSKDLGWVFPLWRSSRNLDMTWQELYKGSAKGQLESRHMWGLIRDTRASDSGLADPVWTRYGPKIIMDLTWVTVSVVWHLVQNREKWLNQANQTESRSTSKKIYCRLGMREIQLWIMQSSYWTTSQKKKGEMVLKISWIFPSLNIMGTLLYLRCHIAWFLTFTLISQIFSTLCRIKTARLLQSTLSMNSDFLQYKKVIPPHMFSHLKTSRTPKHLNWIPSQKSHLFCHCVADSENNTEASLWFSLKDIVRWFSEDVDHLKDSFHIVVL